MSVTDTLSVQRVAVHVVFVMRATGAAVSCRTCDVPPFGGCAGGGCCCSGTGTVTAALSAKASPPAFLPFTLHSRALPASAAWIV